MSCSLGYYAVIEADDEHKKNVAALKYCIDNKIEDLPPSVERYFNSIEIDGAALEYIYEHSKDGVSIYKSIDGYGMRNFEIDLSLLPDKCKKLYFEWC